MVIVESRFVGHLVREELCMVASRDALIDQLKLLGLPSDVGRDELGHLDVVSEDING